MKKQILTMDDLQQIGKLSTTFILSDKIKDCGVNFDVSNYILYLAYWCAWDLNENFGNWDGDEFEVAINYFKLYDNTRKMENINFNGEVMIVREYDGLYHDTNIDQDKRTALRIIQTTESNVTQASLNNFAKRLQYREVN